MIKPFKSILILLCIVLSSITLASARNFNLKTADGSLSNKILYENLALKELKKEIKPSKGAVNGKEVNLKVTEYEKSNNLLKCTKIENLLPSGNTFSNYKCNFRVENFSFVEKNEVRKKNFLGLLGENNKNMLAEFLYENTTSKAKEVISYDSNNIRLLKKFGSYHLVKSSYKDKSFKTSYSFEIKI